MEQKKPDLIVWNKETGYDAATKQYPTNLGAPSFSLPNVSLVRTEASKKMTDVFEREKQEIIERIEKLQNEYSDSIMVWESKISFEPIVGKTYFLYNFGSGNTLSLLSPHEWNKGEFLIGGFILNSENKWIRVHQPYK
jgi:hypothetical protein